MINFKIISKYIKKIDFQIPSTKIYYLLVDNISKYKINFEIKSNQIKNNLIEVETSLFLKSQDISIEKISALIIHSTIIEIDNNVKDKQKLEEIILVKVPTEVYSEIRKSFIFIFEQSGFKNIKIEERVDFEKLYKSRKI